MSTESLIRLTDAAKHFPSNSNGKRPHILTIRRWILSGSRGTRLQGVRVGGQWYTSPEWIAEFMRSGTEKAFRDMKPANSVAVIASKAHQESMARLRKRFNLNDRSKRTKAAKNNSPEAMPDPVLPGSDGEAGVVSGVLSSGDSQGSLG